MAGREIFAGFAIEAVETTYSIAAGGRSRGKVGEVIISSHQDTSG